MTVRRVRKNPPAVFSLKPPEEMEVEMEYKLCDPKRRTFRVLVDPIPGWASSTRTKDTIDEEVAYHLRCAVGLDKYLDSLIFLGPMVCMPSMFTTAVVELARQARTMAKKRRLLRSHLQRSAVSGVVAKPGYLMEG